MGELTEGHEAKIKTGVRIVARREIWPLIPRLKEITEKGNGMIL